MQKQGAAENAGNSYPPLIAKGCFTPEQPTIGRIQAKKSGLLGLRITLFPYQKTVIDGQHMPQNAAGSKLPKRFYPVFSK